MRDTSRVGRTAVLVAALFFLAGFARADLIFLKDGYVLQGRVRRETTAEFDPVTKEMTLIPKGFFTIDDGPRRIYFSPTQVRVVEKLESPVEDRIIQREWKYFLPEGKMPAIEEVLEVQPWNLKTWQREYRFRAPGRGTVAVRQALQSITPYYARVDAISRFPWFSAYLTRELDPKTMHELILTHPDLQDPKEPKDAPKPKPGEKPKLVEKPSPNVMVARRLRLSDFFAQAGWYDIAEKELDRLLKDRPGEKERIARARVTIDKLRTRDLWEQTKSWYQAGRYDAVRKRLDEFPTKNISERIGADMREMKARLVSSATLMAEADKALELCSTKVTTARGKELASAIKVIRTELHPSTVGRLDAFLGQVREIDRQQGRGAKATQTPENLLSLAVSGWLLGSPSSEAASDVAINLWKTRQMVLEYLQESDLQLRQKILETYQRNVVPTVDIDEVTQLIDHLPPVQPATVTPGVTLERKAGKGRGIFTYHLRVPPEYSSTRQYPVLIVLPNSGERPATMIDRWATAAADNGYILAVPEWSRGLGSDYGYSEREHDTVLDTLRDLRRCFQVDSDRVFLFGLGEGGKMAFDVGLAHPDLFAGVLPMCAGPNFYPYRYWRNGQYLPFYCVSGSRAGDSPKLLQDQFKNWVVRSYPSLWIEYKGRGVEWFSGELPNMFDWMRHQRRVFPLRQLGTDGLGGTFGNEFCTMRPEDNRFYWLSTTAINSRHIVKPDRWNNTIQPASITGRIDVPTNTIYLKTTGINQVTVWLGRNPRGQYMIDFDKPLTVIIGFRAAVVNRRIRPSLAVLLEDLYKRGDRKHLFVARIDI